MNIPLIYDFIKELFMNPVTRWVIIILAFYIWIIQGIGFLIRKGIKILFCKKEKSKADSIDTQQEKTLTAINNSPVEYNINKGGYVELK